MPEIIGRQAATKVLDEIWSSKDAEFLAVYGRRRVGKTFLIKEYFSHKNAIYFEITGMKDGSLEEQLFNFAQSLSVTFYEEAPIQTPANWQKAFSMLTDAIEKLPKRQRIVLFFDELPWLATKRSKLMQYLDYFWNRCWGRMPNVKLITCGSAASWMLDKLINAKGGLHNRLTRTLLLRPFTLYETKCFLASQNIRLTDKQILDIYMALGGIPHYLKQIVKGKSATQNINDLCFLQDGLLYSEFPRLYNALFDKAESHLSIVKAIAKKRYGISREALLKATNMQTGGVFSKRIRELEAAGFIETFIPYGYQKKHQHFKLIDEYSLFYLQWIQPMIRQTKKSAPQYYWENLSTTPTYYSWAGYAFESICHKHAAQIAKALNLESIAYKMGSWRHISSTKKETGAQIDLLFDRSDGVITLCEIKYAGKQFAVDKSYAKTLAQKILTFDQQQKSNKQLFLAMVTTQGIKTNIWSEELINNQVILSDLFYGV